MRFRLPMLWCALVASSACAQPQWTATVLHPAGAFSSEVRALAPGQQGGSIQFTSSPNTQNAVAWSGSSSSWTSLGQGFATVYGMTPTQQVGFLNGLGATLWSGAASSAVSLSPSVPGVIFSEAFGAGGGQQVGRANISGDNHAALWRGTSASFVDLTPAGAQSAVAYASDGVYQWGGAGYIGPTGQYGRALRWSGTPESTVDFTPPNAMYAGVLGVGGGVQVGSATLPGFSGHAIMWTGTPESWVDLHPYPLPFGTSISLATTGSVQVGWSHVVGFSLPHAGVWFGTAASFTDLVQFLPPGFGGESAATSVILDRGKIIVGGYCDGPTGQHQAVIWTRDVPAPTSVSAFGALLLLSRRRARARDHLAPL